MNQVQQSKKPPSRSKGHADSGAGMSTAQGSLAGNELFLMQQSRDRESNYSQGHGQPHFGGGHQGGASAHVASTSSGGRGSLSGMMQGGSQSGDAKGSNSGSYHQPRVAGGGVRRH